MSARQLIVLVIAAVAAIGALLLIRGMNATKREGPTPAAEAIAGEDVLVAARDIAQGAALTPSDLAVAKFPERSINDNFVRLTRTPSAQADYVGAVTRRTFVQGEPIIVGAVQQPGGRGFLAAQLEPGYRAVAVKIESETAAGGYIQPNDHVDVIVTMKVSNEGGEDQVRSDVVVRDVRVLALGDKTQPQTSGDAPEQIAADVAVLELTAEEARSVALANEMGDLSLALRGVQIETVGMQSNRGSPFGAQAGGIRIHAFGNVSGGS